MAANTLDRLIGWLSPRHGAERLAYRLAMDETATERGGRRSSYRGGVASRVDKAWSASSSALMGGDWVTRRQTASMRDRARNLDNNDALASAMLDRATENVIGVGIQCNPTTASADFNNEAVKLWRSWWRKCDVRGLLSMGGLQQLLYRCRQRDGDVGCVLVDRGGNALLQVIEGDRISTPFDRLNDKGIIEGVEIDEVGRPRAFHIESRDVDGKISWVRIDANNFVYLPRLSGAAQVRGVTAFAQGFPLFDQLSGYREAAVIAARVAACQALLIKKHNPATGMAALQTATNGAGTTSPIESIEPGMVRYLRPDEDVVQVTPQHPTQSFPEFIASLARFCGLTFGLTLEQVMLDFSRTNYSSARAARLQADQTAYQEQDWFASAFVSRIWQWWISKMVKLGMFTTAVPADYWAHEWIAQGRPWVDPTKEIDAAIKEVKELNVNARSLIAAERGYDFRELCRINKGDADVMRDNGINPQADTQTTTMGVDADGNPVVTQSRAAAPQAAPLNGAQITAALDVMSRLREQSLAASAAAELLAQIGIDRAKAQAMTQNVPAIDGGAGDVAFKREVLKALLAVPAAREAVYNGTDIEDLITQTGLSAEAGYQAPYIPVVAPTGPLVTGGTIQDPQGDVVGGDIETNVPDEMGDGTRTLEGSATAAPEDEPAPEAGNPDPEDGADAPMPMQEPPAKSE